MNIGPLRLRGRIEYKVPTNDPVYGPGEHTWELLAVVFCDLQDVLPSRAESIKTNSLEISANTTRVRMRYRTDVDSSMRLVVDRPGRTIYQFISGPAIIGDKDGLELMAERYSS